jgi:hypothetical protein
MKMMMVEGALVEVLSAEILNLLHVAVRGDNLLHSPLLHSWGASPEKANEKDGIPPLHTAGGRGMEEVMRRIMKELFLFNSLFKVDLWEQRSFY